MLSLGLSVLLANASTVASGAMCSQPDSPAAVRSTPMQMPAMLLASGVHGAAQLIVTLTPESAVPSGVELVQSTGDIIFDAAAIEVVRQTQFVAETRACVAVGGRYFYEFQF